jgi:signal transduction histidine kinase
LTASSHRGIQSDDRSYLVRLVSALTGLAPPEAERRVDQIIAQAKENISRARRTTVILGFMIGAATLLGAAAAWYVSQAVTATGAKRYIHFGIGDGRLPYSANRSALR